MEENDGVGRKKKKNGVGRKEKDGFEGRRRIKVEGKKG